MALRKVLGIETEYGILVRGAPDANPIAASSVLINAYVNGLARSAGDAVAVQDHDGGLGALEQWAFR